jgi:hypothetical protein
VRLKRDDWRMVSNLVRAAMATKNYGKAITAMHQLVTLRVDETRSFGVEAEELQALVHAVVSSVKFQQRTAAAPAAGEADEKAAAASTAASASAVAAVAGSSGDGVAVASGGVPSSSAGPSDGDGSGESKDGAEDWLDSQGVPAANYLDATAKLLGHITSAVSRDARVRCTQTVLFACPLLSRAGSCARRCAGVASLRPGTHGSRQGSGRSRLHDEGGLSLLSFVHCRLHHRCQCASVSCLCLCAVSLPAVRVVGPRARRRVCPCRCVEGPRGVLHARGAIAERRSERVCACTVTGAAACVALSCRVVSCRVVSCRATHIHSWGVKPSRTRRSSSRPMYRGWCGCGTCARFNVFNRWCVTISSAMPHVATFVSLYLSLSLSRSLALSLSLSLSLSHSLTLTPTLSRALPHSHSLSLDVSLHCTGKHRGIHL